MNISDFTFETKAGKYTLLAWIAPLLMGPGLLFERDWGLIPYALFHSVLIVFLIALGYGFGGIGGVVASWLLDFDGSNFRLLHTDSQRGGGE